jgi:pilus assembly protein CpaB
LRRRVLTITLAVLLAVLGTAGVLAYVHQADNRALAQMKAVTALVAQQQIPAGTSAAVALHDGLLRSQALPASSVPADAVRSITPGLGGLVVSAAVPSGQLLLRPMLVTLAQATATGALAIPKGLLAVTMPLCISGAVAGYVQPGSQVAVFDTYATSKKASLQESCDQSGQSNQAQGPGSVVTRIVLPRVLVLAVGAAASGGTTGASTTASGGVFSHNNSTQTDPSASGPAGAVLVTFAVSQANTEKLIGLTRAGLPYLALLTPSSVTGYDSNRMLPLFTPAP